MQDRRSERSGPAAAVAAAVARAAAGVPAVGLALGEAAADVGRRWRPGRRRRARAGRRIEAGWRRETLIGERLVRQPRWTLVSEPCAVGVITISAMLTWGGRVATQRIASATSSAVSGSIPW